MQPWNAESCLRPYTFSHDYIFYIYCIYIFTDRMSRVYEYMGLELESPRRYARFNENGHAKERGRARGRMKKSVREGILDEG